MSYADVLLTADDVVATLEREGTGIFSVDVHDRTRSAEAPRHRQERPDRPTTPRSKP